MVYNQWRLKKLDQITIVLDGKWSGYSLEENSQFIILLLFTYHQQIKIQIQFLFFFFSFCLFRAVSAAYGSSQARIQIGASLLAYTTAPATQDPELCL